MTSIQAASEREEVNLPCRWSYANSMSFAFCETHGDYHRTFLTRPTVCETAKHKAAVEASKESQDEETTWPVGEWQ